MKQTKTETVNVWLSAHTGPAKDIDVIFADNKKVCHTTYASFKKGCVQYPSEQVHVINMVGKTGISKDGKLMTIIEQNPKDLLTIRFENGDIVCNVPLSDFKSGNVTPEYERDTFSAVLHPTESNTLSVAEERKRTLENVLYTLARYRRCAMIRPCGFGKTWIGIKLFGMPQYEKCLFLHPQKDELNLAKVEASGAKVDTHTYAWLRRLSDKAIQKLDYDLIFLDECHTIGGDEDGVGATVTFQAVDKLIKWHPKTHFLGATATAIRMDGINVVEKIFLNHTCYPYTDADAFDDGLLKPPHYFYSVYDMDKKIRERAKRAEKEYGIKLHLDREKVEAILGNSAVNEIDARYMDKHIRDKCGELLPDTSYMRFIVFYLTNAEIVRNKRKVEQWFAKAYPNHQLVSTVVTNRTEVSLQAVDDLPTSQTKEGYKGRIDLIFNCEKLCMGYHSELVTGIVMDRKTVSIAKYQQMIGRLCSFDRETPAIVFDIVDNLHSDFVCKNTRVEECSTVNPMDPEEETFVSILTRYPNAVHWERINANNAKMQLITRGDRKNKTAYIWPNPLSKGDFLASATPRLPEKRTRNITNLTPVSNKRKTLKAFSILDKNVSNMGSATMETVAEDRLRSNVGDSHPQTKNRKHIVVADRSRQTYKRGIKDVLPLSEDVTETIHIVNQDGYTPGMYYYINGEMYSKNVINRMEGTDPEKAIDRMLQRYAEETCKAVIEKWHTYPGCESNYKSYEEIDGKSGKYKFLKACSEIFCCPVQPVITYMLHLHTKNST